MSECSGPGCKHPYHTSASNEVHEPARQPAASKKRLSRRLLTKNQMKSKRKKGIPGY